MARSISTVFTGQAVKVEHGMVPLSPVATMATASSLMSWTELQHGLLCHEAHVTPNILPLKPGSSLLQADIGYMPAPLHL